MLEASVWPSLPLYLCGDLNVGTEEVWALRDALHHSRIHDLGARADAWNKPVSQPTAWAHNSLKPSRIDLVLSNNQGVGLVRDFLHWGFGVFDVHAPVGSVIDAGPPQPLRQLRTCKPVSEGGEDPDKCSKLIDEAFQAQHNRLMRLIQAPSLDAFFECWSATFEHGLQAALKPELPATREGRGKVKVAVAPPPWARDVQVMPESPGLDMEAPPTHGDMLIQKRRFQHLDCLTRKLRQCPGEAWSIEMIRVWHAICACPLARSDPESLPSIAPHVSGWARVSVAAKAAVLTIDRKARACASEARATRRRAFRERLSHKADGANLTMKMMRAEPVARLAFLTGPNGVVADPAALDAIARYAWGQIYTGNSPPGQELPRAREFMSVYREYIPHASQHALAPITCQQVLESFRSLKASAAGPDQWAQRDVRLMRPLAAYWLAQMYNRIEQGYAPWPSFLCTARAVFLAKSGGSTSPLDWRILTISSHVCRRWGAIRLRQLATWAATWMDPSAYGGVPGKSAADATWAQGFLLEQARAQGKAVSTLSIDIYKCVDQISRPLIYTLALAMGAPFGVMRAWMGMMSSMVVMNSLASGEGECYHRPCSIPQGCPLSMLWLTLLTTPWQGRSLH